MYTTINICNLICFLLKSFKMELQKENKVNYINIALMLVSIIAAFVMPFEVFLFAYAFLGPLHYLTEIGWLHKKNISKCKNNPH